MVMLVVSRGDRGCFVVTGGIVAVTVGIAGAVVVHPFADVHREPRDTPRPSASCSAVVRAFSRAMALASAMSSSRLLMVN